MGLSDAFKRIFGGTNSSPYTPHFIDLNDTSASTSTYPTYPPFHMPNTDKSGNGLSNMILINVSGVTHFQNCDPQKVIPKMSIGENLILIADKSNQYDSTAIKIVTTSGNQIGWYPTNGPSKELLFRRLCENREVHCYVNNKGISQRDTYWCEIKIAYYATEYDKSLADKSKEEQDKEKERYENAIKAERKKRLKTLRDTVNSRILELDGIKKEYWEFFMQVLKSKNYLQYLEPKAEGTEFKVSLDKCEVATIKIVRNTTLCVVYANFDLVSAAQSNPDLDVRPATKSEGADKVRLVIKSPSDLLNYRDFISYSYDKASEGLIDFINSTK